MLLNNPSILSDDEIVFDQANEQFIQELARKAAIADEENNKKFAESYQKYKGKADMLDERGIRNELIANKRNSLQAQIMQEMMGTVQEQTVDMTTDYMKRLLDAQQAAISLEELYVDNLKNYRTPEMAVFAQQNQDIFQRKDVFLKDAQKLYALLAKYEDLEEDEGWFDEILDFSKSLLILPHVVDDFIYSNFDPKNLVESLSTKLYFIKNLPEDKQREELEKLGPWIQDNHTLFDNPQDVVDEINTLIAGDSAADAARVGAVVNLLFAGSIIKYFTAGGRFVKSRAEGAKRVGPDGTEEFVGPPTFDSIFVGPKKPESVGSRVEQVTEETTRMQARYNIPDYTPDVVPTAVARADEPISESLLKDAEKVMPRKERKDLEAEVKDLESSLNTATGKEARQLRNRLKKAQQRIADDNRYRDARSEAERILQRNLKRADTEQIEIPSELRAKANERLSQSEREEIMDEIDLLYDLYKSDKKKTARRKRLERKIINDDEAIRAQRKISNIVEKNSQVGTVQKTPIAQAVADALPSGKGTTKPISFEMITVRETAGSKAVADDFVKGTGKLAKADDVLEEIPMMSPPGSWTGSMSAYVAKAVSRTAATLNTMLIKAPTPERMAEVIARSVDEFESTYLGHSVMGSRVDETSGLVTIEIGSSADEAFKTAEEALQASKNLGIDSIKGLSGAAPRRTTDGYVLSVQMNNADPLAAWQELGIIKKSVGNIQDVVPGLAKLAQQADDVERGLTAAIDRIGKKYLRKFNGKKGKNFWDTIERMQKDKTKIYNDAGELVDEVPSWWSVNKFKSEYLSDFGKYPTQDEVLGYITYRQLNDYGYNMKVKTMFQGVVARGDRVSIVRNPLDGEEMGILGHVINPRTILDEKSNTHAILVMGDEPTYKARGKMTADDINDLGRYDVLEVHPSHRQEMYDGGLAEAPVQYIAVPKGSKSRDVVPEDLAQYLGGGRVLDESPYFIKVGRSVTDSAGDSVRLNDATLFTASSAKEAEQGAKKIVKLIDFMKANRDNLDGLTDDALKQFDLKPSKLQTIRGVDDWMKQNGLYDDGFKIQGLADRQVVDMGDLSPPNQVVGDAIAGRSRSRLFGKRSEGVENILGTPSSKADPLKALVTSLDLVNEFASTAALRERAMAYFRKEFGEHLTATSKDPYSILNSEVKPNVPQRTANAIKAHQKYLSYLFRFQASDERHWSSFVERVMNATFDFKDNVFFGRMKGEWDAEKTQKVLERREQFISGAGGNVAGKIRGVTFHTTLGFMNPASFVMQWINVTNIIAISPKHGPKAAMQALGVRAALSSKDGKVADVMSERLHKILGFDSQAEMREMVEEMWLKGIDTVGQNHMYVGGINGLQMQGAGKDMARQLSTFFMDGGEVLNRMTAHLTAWREFKASNPGVSMSSKEARDYIGSRTHDLTLGMSRSDIQIGLRNAPAALFAQFWSYPLRMTHALMPEMMFGVKMGGSKIFNNWEKGRLAAAQLLLWGGAGIPIVGALTDYLVKTYDMDDTTARALSQGGFDTLLYSISGGEIDSNLSDRVGNHQFYKDIFNALTGDKQFFEVVGGATAGRLSQIGGAAAPVLAMIQASATTDIASWSEAGWRAITSMVGTASLADRVRLSLLHGSIMSKSGNKLYPVSKMEAVAMTLGIPPNAYANVGIMFDESRRRREDTKLFKELYLKNMRNFQRAVESGDLSGLAELEKTARNIGILAAEAGVEFEAFNSAFETLGSGTWAEEQTQKIYKDVIKGKPVSPQLKQIAEEIERKKQQ